MGKTWHALSHPQKRVYITEQFIPNTSSSNLSGCTFLPMPVDINCLKQAILAVVKRQEALFVSWRYNQKELQQRFQRPCSFVIQRITENISDYIESEAKLPLDFINGELFVFALLNDGLRAGYFYKFHHIIADAFSIAYMNQEITKTYKRLMNNNEYNTRSTPYRIFLKRETKYLSSISFNEDRKFWEKVFKNPLSPMQLFANHSDDLTTHRAVHRFSVEETTLILHMCQEHKVSLFRFLMCVFYLYFSYWTQSKDIVITTGHHNRLNDEEKAMVGMTVSTVPMLMHVEDNVSFSAFLQNTKAKIKEYLSHHTYPFDLLSGTLRKIGIEPMRLLDITCNHIPSCEDSLDVLRLSPGQDTSLFNIKINPNQRSKDEALEISLDARKALMSNQDMQFFFHRITHIIKQVIANPNILNKDIDSVSPQERALLYQPIHVTFSAPSILTRITASVQEQHHKPAIVCGKEMISYLELDQKSTKFAQHLRSLSIGKENIVALAFDRTIDYVIALLGVLKAGAAFCPLSLEDPKERIDIILRELNSPLVVTNQTHVAQHNDWILMDTLLTPLKDNQSHFVLPSDHELAYIIMTSGTSGIPKGVMIEHAQLNAFTQSYIERLNFNTPKRVSAFCAFSFDVSLAEIVPSLCLGDTIFLIEESLRNDPVRLSNYYENHQIQFATLPTTFGMAFMKQTKNKSLETLIVAGEQLYIDHSQPYQVINAYGPTETTIFALMEYVSNDSGHIPIGYPLKNMEGIVVSKAGKLLPLGATGELWLTGSLVARGYKNSEKNTLEKFIDNPFQKGYRLFKTGDLVKKDEHGKFIFYGRIDTQIKIRGYRVECEEVEIHLERMYGVLRAKVVLDETTQQLMAYVETKEKLSKQDLLFELKKSCPAYMIPNQLLFIDSMPLTKNGKIDLIALPSLALRQNDTARNATILSLNEKKLYDLWKRVLNLKYFNVEDSFFALGGHSLAVMELQMHIEKIFKTTLSVTHLYTHDTLKKQAELLNQQHSSNERIVIMRQGTGTKKMFCIHELFGEVYSYQNIAQQLDPTITVYGIRYTYHKDEVISVSSMARDYIDAIQAIQPNGPYLLLGYSSGGTIAYEMTKQLQEKTETKGLTILIDTPNYAADPSYIRAFYPNVFKYGWHWFSYLPLRQQWRFLRFMGHTLIIKPLKSLIKTGKPQWLLTQRKLRQALKDYRPVLDVYDVFMFRRDPLKNASKDLGWTQLKEEQIVPILGNHVTIIRKENTIKIAHFIHRFLNTKFDPRGEHHE